MWYSDVHISLQINTLLCYTVVSVLVLCIGIARGQYYWIFGALFGTVLILALVLVFSNLFPSLVFFLTSFSFTFVLSQSVFQFVSTVYCLSIKFCFLVFSSFLFLLLLFSLYYSYLYLSMSCYTTFSGLVCPLVLILFFSKF